VQVALTVNGHGMRRLFRSARPTLRIAPWPHSSCFPELPRLALRFGLGVDLDPGRASATIQTVISQCLRLLDCCLLGRKAFDWGNRVTRGYSPDQGRQCVSGSAAFH
jgi:hypothetical protein